MGFTTMVSARHLRVGDWITVQGRAGMVIRIDPADDGMIPVHTAQSDYVFQADDPVALTGPMRRVTRLQGIVSTPPL